VKFTSSHVPCERRVWWVVAFISSQQRFSSDDISRTRPFPSTNHRHSLLVPIVCPLPSIFVVPLRVHHALEAVHQQLPFANTNGELRAKIRCGTAEGPRGLCQTGLNETLRVSTLVLYSPQTLRRHSHSLTEEYTQQGLQNGIVRFDFSFSVSIPGAPCSSPSHPVRAFPF
jgi:hypothetical protein